MKKSRNTTWLERRVSFVTTTSRNSVKLNNIKMPVRELRPDQYPDEFIETGQLKFEGPIEAQWATILKRHPELEGEELVGVLVADTSLVGLGNISWVQQTETVEREVGADRIKEET